MSPNNSIEREIVKAADGLHDAIHAGRRATRMKQVSHRLLFVLAGVLFLIGVSFASFTSGYLLAPQPAVHQRLGWVCPEAAENHVFSPMSSLIDRNLINDGFV